MKPGSDMSDDVVALMRTSLEALVGAAQVFPSVIKTDLYVCIFHIFASKPSSLIHLPRSFSDGFYSNAWHRSLSAHHDTAGTSDTEAIRPRRNAPSR